MVNLLLRDLSLANSMAAAVALALFLVGWSLINAISLSLLIVASMLLIFGSALGFFLSSVSFDWLMRLLGRQAKEEEVSEVEKRRTDRKSKSEMRKEQVNAGKRLIYVGFMILAESLAASLFYMLVL